LDATYIIISMPKS